MLHGAVIRAQCPPQRLVTVHADEARGVPGVHAVLTGADVPEVPTGLFRPDEPLLASSVIRYLGEPVALVAAETAEAARAAASLVWLETEPAPAAVTLAEAMADGAPLVQPDRPNVTEESRVLRGDT